MYNCIKGSIAQWSEPPAHNRLVLGSSPSGPIFSSWGVSSGVRALPSHGRSHWFKSSTPHCLARCPTNLTRISDYSKTENSTLWTAHGVCLLLLRTSCDITLFMHTPHLIFHVNLVRFIFCRYFFPIP